MKNNKGFLTLVCLTSCFCLTNGLLFADKTPGQKLDRTIDSAKEKAKDAERKYEKAKDVAKDKANEAKRDAKEKSDEARRDIAEKIKP